MLDSTREDVNKMLLILDKVGINLFMETMRSLGVISGEEGEEKVSLLPILNTDPDPVALATAFGSLYTMASGNARPFLCRQVVEWRSRLSVKFKLTNFAKKASLRHPTMESGILLFLRQAEGSYSPKSFETASRKEDDLFLQQKKVIETGIEAVLRCQH